MSSIDETKTVEQKVKVGTKCDICGRESRDPKEYNGWHRASTHHSDWGNDSIESYEYHDVCSVECYVKLMRTFLADNDGSYTAEIDDLPIEFVRGIVAMIPEARDAR